MNDIRIALVQMESRVGDPDANATIMEGFMRQAVASRAGLVCFPEASLTGYSAERAADIALSASCAHVQKLFGLADELDIAVCFGFFERASGTKLHIAQPLHVREGTLWHRKTHLGSKEQLTIVPGDMIDVVSVEGVRIGVEVCWETHYPELATIQRAKGAEVILMPFASGISGPARRDAWMKYLPARASDNGLYVLAVNALLDPAATKSPTARGGGILAIDPHGEVIDGYSELGDHMLLCEIDGKLPREAGEDTMGTPSFFDGRRSELFARYR